MYLYLYCVMISVVCVRLHVIFTHGFFSPQKLIFTFLWGNENERHLQTRKYRHLPPIFTHQFSPTTLTDTRCCTRTNTHSNSPVWFHPLIYTHKFSPTDFTHLFSPAFFHPLFFTLSFFTLTVPFARCATEVNFHPQFFVLWFHPLADFTYL